MSLSVASGSSAYRLADFTLLPTISQHRSAALRVLSGCECHRLEVISQSLLKANYAFFSARLMLVADKQALSAFPYPLSRQKRSSLYVDKQALEPLFWNKGGSS
ncbi:hypothetical protein [Siminovitchia fortis]|uniref:hypothetical protein n=1 Tax=Siminovitchia fortis TaxID=254758 RepID=UPI0011A094BA|nr:hypothetical protein [Siminovitchia fortis]